MKNKFIVTISDIHGSRQYTLDKLIKKLLIWLILLAGLAIWGTFSLSQFLSNKLQKVQKQREELVQKQKELEEESKKIIQKLIQEKEKILKEKEQIVALNKMLLFRQQELTQKNEKLKNSIEMQRQTLSSLNKQLEEVEKILGIESMDVDEMNLSKIVSKMDNLKKESLKKLKKVSKLTNQERKILLRSIPIGNPTNYRRISARFGYRLHPIYKRKIFHFGVDLSAPLKTPVYAPADGVVYFRGSKNGYGKFLLLSHDFGFSTAYGHLSKIVVKQGQFVQKGQLIAYVGNTGRSTGPHLHYEVRYLSFWLDPLKFIYWQKDPFFNFKRIGKVDWQGLLRVLRKRYYLSQKIKK